MNDKDKEFLYRLGDALRRSDAGRLAQLRRLKDDENVPLVFFHLLASINDAAITSEKRETRWAQLAHLLALAVLPSRVDGKADALWSKASLGSALVAADVSESRMLRLLNAPEGLALSPARAVVRQLVQRAQSFSIEQLAALVVDTGEARERACRKVARDYYSTLSRGADATN